MTTEPAEPATPSDPAPEGEPPTEPAAQADPSGQLPEDHPLVKAYRATKADLATVKQKADAEREELERLRLSALSDAERAIEEARNAGKAEATSAFGERLARAELKAALTGVVADPADIVAELDVKKYLTDDGEVDTAKVAAVVTKFGGLKPAGAPAGSADGGPMGTPPPPPDLDARIAEAQAKGDARTVIALNSQKLAAQAAGQ